MTDTRTRMLAVLLAATLIGMVVRPAFAQTQTIRAGDAKNHVGEVASVCGVVASATFASRSRRQPTFLNLDVPYPNQIFTGLIWGADRAKFGAPETTYRGKSVCINGRIAEYRGKPEIVISDPAQIRIK